MTRLAVLGPSGRMGAEVIAAATAAPGLELVALIDRAGSPLVGHELAGLRVTADLAALAGAEVYVDFTSPAATRAAAEVAARHKVAAVVGTTGLGDADQAALRALAAVAPLLQAANFSLGVNLLVALAETAARAVGDGWDLEIVELHHRHKRDAPSGTALALGEAMARGRGLDLAAVARRARDGEIGPRPPGEIGFAAVRGGEIVGEHTAYLIADDERLELSHRASSRSIFAKGAVRAAGWLAGRPPGSYGMRDVLGV